MAFGKERAKRKFEALLPPLLEAGEQPVAEVFSVRSRPLGLPEMRE